MASKPLLLHQYCAPIAATTTNTRGTNIRFTVWCDSTTDAAGPGCPAAPRDPNSQDSPEEEAGEGRAGSRSPTYLDKATSVSALRPG